MYGANANILLYTTAAFPLSSNIKSFKLIFIDFYKICQMKLHIS